MRRRHPRSWEDDAVRGLTAVPDHFLAGIARAQRQTFADGRVLNVRPDPIDARDRIYEPNLVAIQATLEVPLLTDQQVRDQGDEGTCTGQALAAVIDLQNAGRGHGLLRVSARMLYQMALAYDGMPLDSLAGSSLRHALKGFYHNGVCSEKMAPYEPHEPAWRLGVEMAKEARECALGAYYRLQNTLYDYHAALNETHSIYCSAMIHDGWRKDRLGATAGVIELPSSPVSLVGGHAFAIIGYDADGFLILNSWGGRWGYHRSCPGVAHWSYEDWQQHVLDAWVLRLQVPSPKTFHLSGGWHELRRTLFGKGRVTMPRIQVNGHYVHVSRGVFVRGGTYWNNESSIDATAEWLRTTSVKEGALSDYDHLLFVADSGLDPLATTVERAAVLTPMLKAKRIYPVFIIWHADFVDRLRGVLDGQAGQFQMRAGGNPELVNGLIERFASEYLRSLWQDLLADAERAAVCAAPRLRAPGSKSGTMATGAAGRAMLALWKAAVERPGGMKVHLAAHSTGAILLGHLILMAAQEGLLGGRARTGTIPLASALASVTLLAPACDVAFFKISYAPARRALRQGGGNDDRRKIAVYALSTERENNDQFGPFHGSFLKLIAAALHTTPKIVGLETVLRERNNFGLQLIVAGRQRNAASAESHLAFCEDEVAMTHILERITAT